MFQVEFNPAALRATSEVVPNGTLLRAIEMLRATGETAHEMGGGAGPTLGRDHLTLALRIGGFTFHYTLDVEQRLISVFSITPDFGATG